MTSTNDTTDTNELHSSDDRTSLVLMDGDVLVYEPENPAAWIVSDAAVSLANLQ